MPPRTKQDDIYQEWFEAIDELLGTFGVAKFAQRTLKTVKALQGDVVFRASLDAPTLATFAATAQHIKEHLEYVLGDADLTQENVVPLRHYIDDIDRGLLNGERGIDFTKSFIGLAGFMLSSGRKTRVRLEGQGPLDDFTVRQQIYDAFWQRKNHLSMSAPRL